MLNLTAKDALAFETRGELSASVDVEWADIFTSEISGLAQLLKVRGPVAIATTVGATCSAKVTIVDTFVVAFARPTDADPLRVAIKKGKVQSADIGAGISISAQLADGGKAIDRVMDEVVAGVLGTATARLNELLQNIAANAMTATDNAPG